MEEQVPAVLVVEDDDQIRDAISELLMDAGFAVRTAVTGWEALAIIEETRFDMVVADIRLPGGLSGIEMTQHARASQPALKCLFMSGQGEPVICDPELDDFVRKPFRGAELVGCVWKVLRGNHPYPRIDIAR